MFNLNIRHNTIWIYVIIGSILVLITEFLSLFNLINQKTILFAWLTISIFIFKFFNDKKIRPSTKLFLFLKSNNLFNNLLLFFIFFVILCTFFISLIYPPNTDDSYAYHLPKVMQWIQNQNLNNFPTSDYRQVSYPPLAEYFLMHFYLFTNSDLLLNLPQWFAMIGTTITISLITKNLGGDQQTQIFASIFSITIPMGIMQSTSTQTDYIVSLWIVISIYFLMLYLNSQNIKNIFGFSLALSLAILTKPTAYIFLFPFCLWLLFFTIKQKKIKNFFYLLLIPVILIIINLGFFFRNFDLFLNPLGINLGVTNEKVDIYIFFSNLIRNFSLNLTLPNVSYNESLRNFIYILHDFINYSVTNPESTYSTKGRSGGDYFIYFSFNENTASNTFHFILILFSIIYYFVFKKKFDKLFRNYFICLIITYILFCIILKWQPWGNRLLLPFFIGFSPLVAILFSNINYKKIKNLVFITLFLYSLPYLFFNHTRPLIGNVYRDTNKFVYQKPEYLYNKRNFLYFPINKSYYKGFLEVAKILNQQRCKTVGIIGSESYREYLIWLLFKQSKSPNVKIFHINIKNKTKKYENKKTDEPCIVFASLANNKTNHKVYSNNFMNNVLWKEFIIFY